MDLFVGDFSVGDGAEKCLGAAFDEDLEPETKGILGEVEPRERGYEGREESWLPVRPSVKASLAGRVMNRSAA